MKKLFAIMSFLVCNVFAMDNETGNQKFSDYSQEDLVSVRIAWAYQENRVGQLKYEASHISSSKVLDYFAGNRYVAIINANDETITTKLDNDKQVILSYEDFNKLLRDQEIVELANKRLKEQYNQNK